MTNDKFGIKKIYPTKSGGLEWFCNWSKNRTITKGNFDTLDSRFGIDKGSDLKIEDNKAKIRGFSSARRFYVKGPWLNTEQTIYIRVRDDGKASSIQLRSRSNHHGTDNLPYPDTGIGSNGDIISCGFGNYLVKWGEKQLDFVSIELEIIHALYRRHLLDKPFVIPKGKFIGFKTVTRNIDVNKIKLEAYNNMDTTGQNWTKTIEYTFDGTNAPVTDETLVKNKQWTDFCINRGDKISADLNNHQIWNKPSYWNWIRINNSDNVDLKYYSVREI